MEGFQRAAPQAKHLKREKKIVPRIGFLENKNKKKINVVYSLANNMGCTVSYKSIRENHTSTFCTVFLSNNVCASFGPFSFVDLSNTVLRVPLFLHASTAQLMAGKHREDSAAGLTSQVQIKNW